jgi:hypothetical protein
MLKISRLVLLSIVTVATAYAAPGHSGSVTIDTEVHAGATSIPAGHYTLRWAADSGNTDLVLAANKHEYTVPVTIKQDSARGDNQVLTHSDGGAQILEGFKVKDQLLMVR